MYIPLRIGLTVVERIPRIFFLLWPQIFFYPILMHHKYAQLSHAWLCVFLHKEIFTYEAKVSIAFVKKNIF